MACGELSFGFDWGMFALAFSHLKTAPTRSLWHAMARRANALVLLDDGLSCEQIAMLLFIDDDAVRRWYSSYEQDGTAVLAWFGDAKPVCQLCSAEQDGVEGLDCASLPHSLQQAGTYMERTFGLCQPPRPSSY